MDTRVLHMGKRSVHMVTVGIPGDSLGVELISSRPSAPRSQRVSICRLRSGEDQRWVDTKDVYSVFSRYRWNPLSTAASKPSRKSGAITPIRQVRFLPRDRAK